VTTKLLLACIEEGARAEVAACGTDRTKLRELFESVWETRIHGFCCDHIATEDGNTDNDSIDFCIAQAKERKHFDCLVMMMVLRAIEDEELRDRVVTNEP
jgi:DNA polymerase IIIc chi subunit